MPTPESSWGDLAKELKGLNQPGKPMRAEWFANEGSEDYGIWLLLPDGPETAAIRADFSLIAAYTIGKLGLPPIPIPEPLQFDRQWRLYCQAEEKIARLEGKTRDLSDAVPYGLGETDKDAVDPCTRAWLELLRRESPEFHCSATGWRTIEGNKYNCAHGTIQNVCAASAVYCTQRARDEIGARSSGRLESALPTASDTGQANSGASRVAPAISGDKEGAMARLPELPPKFQNAFEAAKAAAELENADGSAGVPYHTPLSDALRDRSLRLPILIQNAFFAYCQQARSACKEGIWTVTRAREAAEAALPIICDLYLTRESCPADQIAAVREHFMKGIRLDERWVQHLTALRALAESARSESAIDDAVAPPAPEPRLTPLAKGRQHPAWFRSGDATLSLRKPNGTVFEGLAAHLSSKAILIMDVSNPIENEDILIRTLSGGFRVGFIVDDPGYREALGSIPARFEVKAHRAAPIDSLEPSEFWRRLRDEFERLSELQREALGIDRDHRLWLSGICSKPDEQTGEFGCCSIHGGLNLAFLSKLEDVATRAGIAVGGPPDASAVEFWLSCLCLDLLQSSREGALKELWQSVPGGGIVKDLLASSAGYCSRLAAMADRKANEARLRSEGEEESCQAQIELTHSSSESASDTAADVGALSTDPQFYEHITSLSEGLRVAICTYAYPLPPAAGSDAYGGSGIFTKEPIGVKPGNAPYPKRATWFENELAARQWNVHDFQAQGGPDWKTSRKILDGLMVSRAVLEKATAALSKKKRQVSFAEIPQE